MAIAARSLDGGVIHLHMGKPARRILVIDDSADLRELYEMLFAGEGYDVQAASDALRGFERARNWRPDVILLDVVMPGMDGLELLRKLRSDLVPPVPPVILCSGFELSEAEALQRGAVCFLRKPAESEDLLGAVKDALNGKKAPLVKGRQQRLRSSAARARALETARTLVSRLEAYGQAPMSAFEALSQVKLETLATFLGVPRGATALVRGRKLAVLAATPATGLESGFDLGTALPHAYTVLETGSSLILSDAASSRFAAVSRSLGGMRFFAGVPLRVGGVPVGVCCLYDPRPRPYDADELAALELVGRRGSDVLLRFAETGDAEKLVLQGHGIVVRELFDELFEAELRLLDRRGGSMQLAVLDLASLEDVDRVLMGARSERMMAGLISPLRIALFKRTEDDSAGRDLAEVVKALRSGDRARAVGIVDIVGAGVRGLAARDLVHVACLALDRAEERGDPERRVVIEERPV
jgi:CheY-like chemotaxis protein